MDERKPVEILELDEMLEPEAIQEKVFRALIRFVQSEEEPLILDWTDDDIDGQARCIRDLSLQATSPHFPYEQRVWAFDQLQEVSNDYFKSGKLGDAPPEILAWCLSVAAGAVERPKRGRGRPGWNGLSEQRRNRLIVVCLTYLTSQGETLTKAKKLVGDAAGLSDRRVDSILSETSVDRTKGKYVPESVMRILLDAQNE